MSRDDMYFRNQTGPYAQKRVATNPETLRIMIRHGEDAIADVHSELALLDEHGWTKNIAVDRAIDEYHTKLQQRIGTFQSSVERWQKELTDQGASL